MRVTARGVRTLLIASIAAAAGIAATAATGSTQVGSSPPQSAQTPTPTPTPDPPKGTGILIGQIIDASTRRPVAGATVNISGGPMSAPTPEVIVMSPLGPLPGAISDAPRQILTNSDGQFLFRALTAGRYSLRASAPGYLSGVFGQARPTGSSQTIELTRDDEKRADLVVRLWKSASISGRIVDEAGEPVVDLGVRIYKRDIVAGRPRLSNYSSPYTDDRGVYRATGLPPGEYVVGISSTQSTMPVATAEAYYQEMVTGGSMSDRAVYNNLSSSGASIVTSGYRVGDFLLSAQGSGRGSMSGAPLPPAADGRLAVYARQYFPTATTIPQASTITLASGEDRAGIDLQLKLVPTVRVSGTLVGPDGPAGNLGLRLTPIDSEGLSISPFSSDGASTATDASGAFTFLGVTPGQYTLTCQKVPRAQSTSVMTSSIEITGPNGMMMGISSGGGPSIPPALPADPSLFVSMPLTVTETDMHGLSVTLRPGTKLAGKLVFEGTKDQPIADQLIRTSIQITAAANSTFSSPINRPATKTEADGRFATMGYPPGRYTISASLPTVPGGVSGWRFKSATLGGVNVDDGFDISDRDISTLVITFTDRSTELSGTVTDASGQPDKLANVITIPADAQGWKQGNINSRRVRSTRTTTTGAYQIADLPAGEYFIAAISDEELQNWQDPKTLEAITRVATHITLGEGEKRAESLKTRSIR